MGARKVLRAPAFRETKNLSLPRFEKGEGTESLGRATNPYLSRSSDSGEVNGLHSLASRFVEGETLADLLERDGPLPLPARPDRRRARHRVDALHEAGLVHRDIKPSNVMLGAEARR